VTFSGLNLGDSREQVLISALSPVMFLTKLGVVSFLSSLVQVSLGTAQLQSDSIARLFTPLTILNNPSSPQKLPQLFLPSQYLTPFS